ncbi:hypothetical protein LIER_16174 [Lithospermum erythrorhizon]|uniref:Uncharacterized protein n=1 Tax=Lithospermum erythrorhizon TaxID=34254 RepID=A0AAV3Q845_LITER
MESLIIDGQHHRNQYCSGNFVQSSGQFGSSGSTMSSRKHEGFHCRSYHLGAGLLPTPIKSKSFVDTSIKQEIDALSPKTPSPSIYSSSGDTKNGRKPVRSSAVSIPMTMKLDDGHVKKGVFVDELYFSELWAGPTYSNSPPPSSLPIPKFSMKPKRTVSLELPSSVSPIELRPIAKSAPTSPTHERNPSPIYFLSDVESVMETSDQHYLQQESVDDSEFATKALRRILNLDNDDQ